MHSAPRLALLLLAGLIGSFGGFAAEPVLMPVPGRPLASDFTLADPDGLLHRLSDHRGRPVILNFWATWCPPCRAEMPSMQRAHETLVKEGIVLIAVNVGDDIDSIDEFLAVLPVTFPLPLDRDGQVAARYPMRGLPTTFVIDPNGRIVLRAVGEQRWDDPEVLNRVRALQPTPASTGADQ